MPLVQTRGAASAQGFGEFAQAAVAANYIEDVFSTWLYTGTGSTQTITNNIDISTKGGLVWIKQRNGSFGHYLTYPGLDNGSQQGYLSSETTDPAGYNSTGLTAFNTNGFTVDSNGQTNGASKTYVSWTFREQPKFFDVVTYTGNGNGAGQTINHGLGSVPGFIICKSTSATGDWAVCARTGSGTYATGLSLNKTTAAGYSGSLGDAPTATTFSTAGIFDATSTYPNVNGVTYVAYIFAHNAGGFGLTGTDNVISCGSYTGTGAAGNAITLGYEPQWILAKASSAAQYWQMFDVMRGMPVGSSNDSALYPNVSNAEAVNENGFSPTATGFVTDGSNNNLNGVGYIYIAIRRGPMKVPTLGTSVLAAVTRSGNSTQTIVTGASSPPDLVMVKSRNNATEFAFTDRLRGVTQELSSAYTFSEADFGANPTVSINMNGWTAPAGYGTFNQSGYTYVDYLLSRYPNVFDEVCYTGTGSNLTLPHNLTVAPELVIAKVRNTSSSWGVSTSTDWTKYLLLNSTNAQASASLFGTPDATNFYPTASGGFSGSGNTYVAYLFATCPGVSKCGSYTGTGTTQTINCGFTTGARFVLIKRTDATGAWYVYDTARGMTVLTDPYLLLNSTAAEVATLGSVTTVSTGFALNSAILADINVSAGTYIFLAIA